MMWCCSSILVGLQKIGWIELTMLIFKAGNVWVTSIDSALLKGSGRCCEHLGKKDSERCLSTLFVSVKTVE